jgi:hypothetical protein
MTLIKNVTLLNGSTAAEGLSLESGMYGFEEDPGEWDTEEVEGATGTTFSNGRRAMPIGRWKFTLFGTRSGTLIQNVLSIKTAAKGRLYGFKWKCPSDSTTYDVKFTKDELVLKSIAGTANTTADIKTSVDIELRQVLNGVPAP